MSDCQPGNHALQRSVLECALGAFRLTGLGHHVSLSRSEPPQAAEFLQKRLISEFFGFQWQNLAEILSLFKKYNNLRKVAVREKV